MEEQSVVTLWSSIMVSWHFIFLATCLLPQSNKQILPLSQLRDCCPHSGSLGVLPSSSNGLSNHFLKLYSATPLNGLMENDVSSASLHLVLFQLFFFSIVLLPSLSDGITVSLVSTCDCVAHFLSSFGSLKKPIFLFSQYFQDFSDYKHMSEFNQCDLFLIPGH